MDVISLMRRHLSPLTPLVISNSDRLYFLAFISSPNSDVSFQNSPLRSLLLALGFDKCRDRPRRSTRAGRVALALGGADKYVILAKTGISTVPTSAITGNIAVSPIAAGAITGFSLTLDSAGQSSTSDQVVGKATAASYGGAAATALTTAVSAMETAYTDAAGRPNIDAARINLGTGALRGDFGCATHPLTPGVYTFGTDVTIDAGIFFEGTDTDILIIQIAVDLIQADGVSVTLVAAPDSATVPKAENIFWQVVGKVVVGAGAHMEGILLVQTDVLFKTGSSPNGRILSQTACNLQMATITEA
jgi:hypothetical protein